MNSAVIFTLLTVVICIEAKAFLNNNKKDVEIKSQALIKSFYTSQNFTRYCGGVVISPRVILTETDCIVDSFRFAAAVGIEKITSETDFFVDDCTTAASIVGDDYVTQIGFLTYLKPINGGDVVVATLPVRDSDVLANDPVYVTGYGTFNADQEISTLQLTVAEFKGIDRKTCLNLYRSLVNDVTFCYSSEDTSPCQVDFGSPVYSDENTVVGLTYFRENDECSERRPVVSRRLGYGELLDYIIDEITTDPYVFNCSMNKNNFQKINQKFKLLK